jgi:uncharacterized protein with von Willebrand factor type A (vWA) domain
MFIRFFYTLKEVGIPVSPTSFLLLQRAMHANLVSSLSDFYIAARSILVKSEKYFDLYDQVFAHTFEGAELPTAEESDFDLVAAGLLDEWLKNPKKLARALNLDERQVAKMSPAELLDYFKKRLQEQKGRHEGGSKWIGTGGTSPTGHSGYHPGGMRVGGESINKSAVKMAGERRYKDYSTDGPLTRRSLAEALKRLRNLVPQGTRDRINVDDSIYRTIKNGGEIELVFDRSVVDRLKIVLAIDNGGWSMDPYVDLVQTLFVYARSQFKDLQTYYFHNTIYDQLWQDAGRIRRPVLVDNFIRLDPDTRLIIVGDASMAPYELMSADGSIYAFERSGRASIERLRLLAATFRHVVWLNPIPKCDWQDTRTITLIGSIFPMFELSLDGLEQAVTSLIRR